MIPNRPDPAGVVAKIRAVGKAVGAETKGDELAASIEASLQESAQVAAAVAAPKRVLFILSLQGGRVMAGGEKSSADGIIALAVRPMR